MLFCALFIIPTIIRGHSLAGQRMILRMDWSLVWAASWRKIRRSYQSPICRQVGGRAVKLPVCRGNDMSWKMVNTIRSATIAPDIAFSTDASPSVLTSDIAHVGFIRKESL